MERIVGNHQGNFDWEDLDKRSSEDESYTDLTGNDGLEDCKTVSETYLDPRCDSTTNKLLSERECDDNDSIIKEERKKMIMEQRGANNEKNE